jgi:hypothetical protein
MQALRMRPQVTQEAPTPLSSPDISPEPVTRRKRKYLWYWLFCTVAGLVLGSCGTYLWMRAAAKASPKDQVSRFWSTFFKKDHPVIAVFSNPRLSGRLAFGGLRYYDQGIPPVSSDPPNLSYAGTGDVHAVYLLTRLFGQYHWNLNLQSGALLSWDQAKVANLVFIGRPEQNPACSNFHCFGIFTLSLPRALSTLTRNQGKAPSTIPKNLTTTMQLLRLFQALTRK